MYRSLAGIVVGIVGMMLCEGSVAGEATLTQKITKDARETFEATKSFTAEQKELFQRTVHEDLLAVQKQITALRAKAHHASEATRAELDQSIRELEQKKQVAKGKLEELRVSTDARWAEVKSGVNKAVDELKRAYDKARSFLP